MIIYVLNKIKRVSRIATPRVLVSCDSYRTRESLPLHRRRVASVSGKGGRTSPHRKKGRQSRRW